MDRNVATLWITRRGEETPELLVAWDEYSIESNYEGWQNDCDKALKEIGDDVRQFRFISLVIPESEIDKYFIEFESVQVAKTQELDDPRNI